MKKKSKSKIVVIGAGLIGRKHIDVAAKFAKLDAIVDPDPAAQALAQAHDAKWFESVDEYLEKHEPHGAIVATPNHLHLPNGVSCIAHHVPVLIEKPLADSVENAASLVARAEAARVAILVGHHRRHSARVKAAKSVIESGQLGKIVIVNAQFWLFKPEDYFETEWRRQAGAGPTYINLIHDIDLLRHFCGDIVSVQACESNATRGFEVEDSSAVILQFESGVLGTVSISDTVVAPWSWELTSGENPIYPKTEMSCYSLGGTKGSLSIPDLRLWNHPNQRSWWEPIEAKQLQAEANDPVEDQFLHFLDVIEHEAVPLVSGREGLKNLQVLDAIKSAALNGRTEINID